MAKVTAEENGKAGQAPFMSTKRKCRDIPFLILFLAIWIVMIVIAQNAVSTGNPRLLM
jgi:solute carrier family 44 protein 1 (choline transporter-like protein)/choline transporter-like protein 2/4/5